MKIYTCTVQGIYRQEIIGIYNLKEKAFEACKIAIEKEHDDYHTFEVGECEINTAVDDVECIGGYYRQGTKVFKREGIDP